MRFKKKPAVIDAVQWAGDNYDDVYELAIGAKDCTLEQVDNVLVIGTLNGNVTAGVGEWVIRGIEGELYPCREDIFKATYERTYED